MLAGVGGLKRLDGLEAPLTSRAADLRTIRELFHAATERRAPRTVLISGPAGAGKSWLGRSPALPDAMEAVPDYLDASQIRGQAVTTLIRGAERAEPTYGPHTTHRRAGHGRR